MNDESHFNIQQYSVHRVDGGRTNKAQLLREQPIVLVLLPCEYYRTNSHLGNKINQTKNTINTRLFNNGSNPTLHTPTKQQRIVNWTVKIFILKTKVDLIYPILLPSSSSKLHHKRLIIKIHTPVRYFSILLLQHCYHIRIYEVAVRPVRRHWSQPWAPIFVNPSTNCGTMLASLILNPVELGSSMLP